MAADARWGRVGRRPVRICLVDLPHMIEDIVRDAFPEGSVEVGTGPPDQRLQDGPTIVIASRSPLADGALGLALACELDPVLGGVRLTAGLVVNLSCVNAAERAAVLSRLAADAPLAERGLLEISGRGVTAEIRIGAAVYRHAIGLPDPPP